jgi:hypothetical protein
MSIGIEGLWKELESSSTVDSKRHGWTLRLARPRASFPIFVAVGPGSGGRALLLRLPQDFLPSRRKWPRCKGLDPVVLEMDGHSHIGVILKELRFADVFTALAEDLIRRVGIANSIEDQVNVFIGQLERWQRFLSANREGLGEEQQRGLWGELHFLRDHLLPEFGSSAVDSWKGPDRAHQDFQFENKAVEIKTTLAKQPQLVRITSERQLDNTAFQSLFMCVIVLDTREGAGTSLPSLIQSIRQILLSDVSATERFEDLLLAAGYLDAHESRYMEIGYVIRKSIFFKIIRGFPRIVERDLAPGLGNVSYGLSISACTEFEVSGSEMMKSLGKTSLKVREGAK